MAVDSPPVPAKARAYAAGLQAYRLYRLWSAPERVRMRAVIRRWIRSAPPGARIVEVGGGTSMLRPMIEREVPGARYASGDIAPTNNSALVADATRMPFAEGCIEALLALEVLEHIPEPRQLLAEAGRVLVDGGTLVLTTPFMFGVHDYRDYFRYTPLGLQQLIEGTGLELEEVALRGGTFVSSFGLLRNLIRDAIVGDPAGWRAQGSRKKVLWGVATVVMVPWVPVMWAAMAADRTVDRDSKSPPGYFFRLRRRPRVS